MNTGRSHQNTVLLPDGGMVAVGGGYGDRKPLGQWATGPEHRAVELYDPATGSWRLGAAQQEGRAYHSTALLLPDGRVLSAGDDINGSPNGDTAEIYEPPYLHRGPRPTITSAPEGLMWGDNFHVGTPDAVTRAVVMAPGRGHARQRHEPAPRRARRDRPYTRPGRRPARARRRQRRAPGRPSISCSRTGSRRSRAGCGSAFRRRRPAGTAAVSARRDHHGLPRPAGPPPSPPGGGPSSPDAGRANTPAVPLRVKLHVPRIARRSLRVVGTLNRAATVRITARLGGPTGRLVAQRATVYSKAGTRTLTLRLSSRARRSIAGARSRRLLVTVFARDASRATAIARASVRV